MASTRPYSLESGSEKLIPSPGYTPGSTAYSPFSKSSGRFPDNEPFNRNSTHSGFQSINEAEEKDRIYKKRIRIVRLISRIGSLLVNAFLVGSLSYTLAKYYLTKDHVISGNLHPWATPTVLWPTFMLLGIATLSFFLSLITICAYACGIGAANKTHSCASYIGYVLMGVHVIVWGVSVGLYKYANTGKDLWGWSCGDTADKIQDEVKSFLDFGKLCTVQTYSWYGSIVEAVAYGATFIAIILVFRRSQHKKKLAKIRESVREGYFTQRDVELGTTYQPTNGRRYMPVAASPQL